MNKSVTGLIIFRCSGFIDTGRYIGYLQTDHR